MFDSVLIITPWRVSFGLMIKRCNAVLLIVDDNGTINRRVPYNRLWNDDDRTTTGLRLRTESSMNNIANSPGEKIYLQRVKIIRMRNINLPKWGLHYLTKSNLIFFGRSWAASTRAACFNCHSVAVGWM
jgi:hypothetical protein